MRKRLASVPEEKEDGAEPLPTPPSQLEDQPGSPMDENASLPSLKTRNKPTVEATLRRIKPQVTAYPASRGFSLVFLSVVLPFSSRFWLLAFCFGCEPAEEKTSADSRLRFLLNMLEMKMRLPWNFCHVSVIRCCRRSLLMYS